MMEVDIGLWGKSYSELKMLLLERALEKEGVYG